MSVHDLQQDPEARSRHRRYDEDVIYERFVLRELEGEELSAFESHLLTCDHCLDRLQEVELLRSGLEEVAIEEGVGLQQQVQASLFLAWLQGLASRPMVSIGFAASVLGIALLSTVVWRQQGRLQDLQADLERAAGPPAQTLLLPLDLVRSTATGQAPVLELTERDEWIVLTVPVGDPMATFQATLSTSDGTLQWRRDGLTADGSRRVLIGLPSGSLRQDTYVLELSPEGATQAAPGRRTFELKVRRPA